MDDRARKALMRINASIPQNLRSGLVKKQWNTREEQMVREAAGRISDPMKRKEVEQKISEGHFRHEEKVVDQEKTKQINDFLDRRISEEIKRGNLKTMDRRSVDIEQRGLHRR